VSSDDGGRDPRRGEDADTVRQYLAGFVAAGPDDVICFRASADASQVDRLAKVALN